MDNDDGEKLTPATESGVLVVGDDSDNNTTTATAPPPNGPPDAPSDGPSDTPTPTPTPDTPDNKTSIEITRTVSSSKVAPSEQATVTTEITGAHGLVVIASRYDPQLSAVSIQSVTVNVTSANPSLSQATVNGSTVALGDVGTDATVTVSESLTVGDEANITHRITGDVTAGETTVEIDPVSVTIANTEPQSVVDEYDTNNDGSINITELGTAGADFARGELSITELGRLGTEFASSSSS